MLKIDKMMSYQVSKCKGGMNLAMEEFNLSGLY